SARDLEELFPVGLRGSSRASIRPREELCPLGQEALRLAFSASSVLTRLHQKGRPQRKPRGEKLSVTAVLHSRKQSSVVPVVL
ncbi:Hypothetical predicted protein, partial [Marmota monax]